MNLQQKLAVNRTRLANERTLLAYVRTFLGFIALGVAIIEFFEWEFGLPLGIAAMFLGLIVMLLGNNFLCPYK